MKITNKNLKQDAQRLAQIARAAKEAGDEERYGRAIRALRNLDSTWKENYRQAYGVPENELEEAQQIVSDLDSQIEKQKGILERQKKVTYANSSTPQAREARKSRIAETQSNIDRLQEEKLKYPLPPDPTFGNGFVEDNVIVPMGRGATSVGQGVKQLGLQLFGDEGESEAYTKALNEEAARYERDYAGNKIAKVSEIAGSMAPGMLVGGGAPLVAAKSLSKVAPVAAQRLGSATTGIFGSMALGGLEGAALPTESNELKDRIPSALLGTALGPVGNLIPSAFRGRVPFMNPSDPATVDVVSQAAKGNLVLPPGAVDPRAGSKLFNKMSESQVGTGATTPATRVRDSVNAMRSNGKPSDLPSSVRTQINNDREMLKEAYGEVQDLIPRGVRYEVDDDLANQLLEAFKASPDALSSIDKNRIEKILDYAQTTGRFSDWKKLQTEIGSFANWNGPADAKSRPLRQAYQAVKDSIYKQTRDKAGDDALSALEAADSAARELWQARGVVNMTDDLTGGLLQKARSFKDPGEGEAFIRQLDPEARANMVNTVVDDMVLQVGRLAQDADVSSYASHIAQYAPLAEGFRKSGMNEVADELVQISRTMNNLAKLKESSPELFNTVAGAVLTFGGSTFAPRLFMREAGMKSVLKRFNSMIEDGFDPARALVESQLARRFSQAASQQVVGEGVREISESNRRPIDNRN